MTHVTEIVLFRLSEGVTEAEFLAAAQTTFDLLTSYPGYIHREMSVSDDGLWMDIAIWASMEDALHAADNFLKTGAGQQFGALIAMDSVQMAHGRPRLSTTEKVK